MKYRTIRYVMKSFAVFLALLIFIVIINPRNVLSQGIWGCAYEFCTSVGGNPCQDSTAEEECIDAGSCDVNYNTCQCCRRLICNCGTSSDPCWRGSIYYWNCSDLCDALGQDCPPPCTPGCNACANYDYLQSSYTSYGTKTVSCVDDCGDTDWDTCYCISQCTPPSCPDNTYDTDQGNGYIPITCVEPNECGVNSTRTCYCPAADCADLDDIVTWLNSCPVGEECREYNGSVPIPNNPEGCPATQTKTCYTTNPRPNPPDNVSLEMEVRHQSEVELISLTPYPKSKLLRKLVQDIKAAGFDEDTVMGYWSNTHSGREIPEYGLNNPVGLHAEYGDSDGQEDIVALYVWWSPKTSNTNLVLPNKLDITGNLEAKTDTEDNWGFLITRSEYNGTWQNVYVPNLEGSNRAWVNAGNISETITVKGPSENTMVELSGINVRAVGSDEVHLDLLMTFRSEGTNDIVSTDQYNLWGLVNDYVGFTKFEDNGEIKDSANSLWKDSNEDWTLDMVQPVINILDVVDTAKSQVTVNIDIDDEDELSYIRLDACKSGIDTPSPLGSEYIDNYPLQTCDTFSGESVDVTVLDSLLGTEGKRYDNNQSSYTSDVDIYLGNHKEGAITFHLTVLDKAGNVKQDTEIYKLEQWATAKDGFVFGLNGVTSSTRGVDVSEWDGHPVLEGFRNSYVNEVDLTNQVLLGAKSFSYIFLRELIHTDSNNSFSAANYPGIFLGLPYQELKMAYKNKVGKEDNIDLVSIGNTLTGGLPTSCTKEYCILERNGNLLIDNFVCDGKALIAVDGNVTIEPNLTNDTNQDACIILASGDIQIGDESNVTVKEVEEAPEYDIVEAFLIAGGKIDIPSETVDPEGDKNDDGLYIEGGLVSFTPPSGLENRSSVYNQREIHFSNMGVYPVLVVDNNAKYGLLSKTVFGSQIDIFKIEVGFKPY